MKLSVTSIALAAAWVSSVEGASPSTSRVRKHRLMKLIEDADKSQDTSEFNSGALLSMMARGDLVDHGPMRRRISKLTSSVFNDAKDTNERRTQECTLTDVNLGTCTIQDFCDFVGITGTDQSLPGSCDGTPSQWTYTSSSPETCLYFGRPSEDDDGFDTGIYDPDIYNPDVDVCFQITTIVEFEQENAVSREEISDVTRPFPTRLSQTFDIDTVDDVGTCTSAVVDDVFQCLSCQPCPSGSLGNTNLDCSNVYPDLTTDCADFDDDVSLDLAIVSGNICGFSSVIDGWCSLDDYVALLQAVATTAGEDAFVSYVGSVEGNWTLFINYNEICYYTASDSEDVYNWKIFDPDNGDYCFVEYEAIDFFQERPLTEYFAFLVTRPVELGEYYLSTAEELLDDCGELDDDIFFPSICNDVNACPETFVNDVLCTSPCNSCPDGSSAITCTNVDPSLVDTCDEFDDDELVDDITNVLVEYFRNIAGPRNAYKGKGKGKGKGEGKSKKMKSGKMMGMSKSKKSGGMKSKKAPKPKKGPKSKKGPWSKSEPMSKKSTKKSNNWTYKGKGK
eukprot:scaffold353_cov185-Amphora_coffeaeformis.AAC.39